MSSAQCSLDPGVDQISMQCNFCKYKLLIHTDATHLSPRYSAKRRFQGLRLSSVDPPAHSRPAPLSVAELRGVPASLGGWTLYSCRLRSRSLLIPPTSSISLARVRSPLRFSSGDGSNASGEDRMRLALVFLFAMGKDLLCSPVSFLFWVGNSVAYSGIHVVLSPRCWPW